MAESRPAGGIRDAIMRRCAGTRDGRHARRSRSTRRRAGASRPAASTSFVREQGLGGTARRSCSLHGVPTSSFLYRKVIPALAEQGLRAVAFDFPGLGLAERPESFDYSWSGLRGGPAMRSTRSGSSAAIWWSTTSAGRSACEWAVRNPDRVLSLTALNTHARRGHVPPPVVDAPRSPIPGIGRVCAGVLRPPARCLAALLPARGSPTAPRCPAREVYAHYYLLKRGDGGRAFLRIMRGFELTEDEAALPVGGARRAPLPGADRLGRARPGARPRSAAARPGGAGGRRPDPAAGQALPPGGPGDRGRPGDRRPRRAARLRRRSAQAGAGARAPFSISRGSPRSGNGISTTSKSRGASAPGNSSRASASTSRTS